MLIDVVRNLKKEGHEILYWEGSKKYFDSVRKSGEFKDTIFHSTYDAIRGIPAPEAESERFLAIGEDILEKLLPCESQVLSMMMAVDYDNMPLFQKKRIFYEYVRYVNGLLDSLRPDAVVFGDIPHIAHQYTLYQVAKLKNIKTIMLRTIPVLGRLIFFTNHELYGELKRELEKTAEKTIKISDLGDDVRKYYELQSESKKEAHPFYMGKDYLGAFAKSKKFLRGPHLIMKHIRQGTFIKTLAGYIRMLFIKRHVASLEGKVLSGFSIMKGQRIAQKKKESFQKEYAPFIEKPDFSKKYIYVALHKQPEASTSAMGDIFTDQILMVDILSQAIPPDWVLYVKENPLQFENPRGELGRYHGYYKDMKKRNNIHFVSTKEDTYGLMKHAQAVATVTGTTGFEAVLRGKPALIFGHIWYQHCEGVFKIDNLMSCKEAVNAITKGYKPNKQKIINFMYALQRGTVIGFPNIRFQKDAGISVEENIKNITTEISNILLGN
jgi:hypothetical protein